MFRRVQVIGILVLAMVSVGYSFDHWSSVETFGLGFACQTDYAVGIQMYPQAQFLYGGQGQFVGTFGPGGAAAEQNTAASLAQSAIYNASGATQLASAVGIQGSFSIGAPTTFGMSFEQMSFRTGQNLPW